MGFIERIHAKIELFRLEQRYTRHRNRRSTFVSNAIYVDGEYIFQTPTTTGSSQNSADSGNVSPTIYEEPASHNSPTAAPVSTMTPKQRKKMNRFSSMPGFGTSSMREAMAPAPDWRTQRASFDGSR